MKRVIILSLFAFIAAFSLNTSASAQRNIDPAIDRDPIFERDAKHNLDVAWQSYRLKKAYRKHRAAVVTSGAFAFLLASALGTLAN